MALLGWRGPSGSVPRTSRHSPLERAPSASGAVAPAPTCQGLRLCSPGEKMAGIGGGSSRGGRPTREPPAGIGRWQRLEGAADQSGRGRGGGGARRKRMTEREGRMTERQGRVRRAEDPHGQPDLGAPSAPVPRGGRPAARAPAPSGTFGYAQRVMPFPPDVLAGHPAAEEVETETGRPEGPPHRTIAPVALDGEGFFSRIRSGRARRPSRRAHAPGEDAGGRRASVGVRPRLLPPDHHPTPI